MNYGERTVGVRGEGVARGRVVPGAVDALPNWDGGDHFAGLIVGDRHQAAAASAEQAVVGGVNSHGDRLPARGGGPAPQHSSVLGVDLDHLAGVGEIGVDLAVAG